MLVKGTDNTGIWDFIVEPTSTKPFSFDAFCSFLLLTIMTSATMNICVQVSGWAYFFISLEYSPKSGNTGYCMVNLYFAF